MDEQDKKLNDDTDDLIARVERQIDEIECAEFLHDMTADALEEKGFIGEKSINFGKSRMSLATEKEHLLFEPNILFERLDDKANFFAIKVETLLHIPDVERGQLIATRAANESIPFDAGENVFANVINGEVQYRSKIRGKPVIIKNELHIVPSDADSSFKITLDSEGMNAYLECTPAYGSGLPLVAKDILAELDHLGIRYGINESYIQQIVDEVNNVKEAKKQSVIASGKLPVNEKKGIVSFKFETKPTDYEFSILPDGKIDYKKSKSILTATSGQLLAHVGPNTPGIKGTDIFGEEVVFESIKDDSDIIPGSGVMVSTNDNGTDYFAAISGSIILNGAILDVVNMYVVEGDVDYTTGNISFNGNVLITGTVIDGFEVTAEGDIFVSKIVESAKLVAGRDIIVKGGVLGRSKGILSAGRDIRIGYAQNARLEAQGNIYIGNYAVNSYIATSKQLIMLEKRGSVIGGEVYALRGIDVRSLGSENSTKTYVEAGTDYLILRMVKEMNVVVEFCEQNVRKINEALKTLATKLASGTELTPTLRSSMQKALDKKRDLEHRKKRVISKRNDLQKAALEKDRCYVKVKDTCYADVTIKIKEFRILVSKERDHVKFFDDLKAGDIVTSSY
ncbi:MAG: DUF342 domain-containing protein [Fibrobacter sp.]|nr:DUF342 domain-containing protein [Fibrobacter sp.]